MVQVKIYTVNEAKKALEHYCAYQERCHQEVVLKLQRMRMIPEAIDTILVHLIQHNYLNETRYAQAFARGKFRIKKWGKQRITRELKQRNISAYNMTKALQEINDKEYLETLHLLVSSKLSVLGNETLWGKRKKLSNYLFYRGWEPHLVYNVLDDLVIK